MSSSSSSAEEDLAQLRQSIDEIDARLHDLLIARGEIIHHLIEVKARTGGGLAFRPEREARMMRRLIERHHGLLPVDTIESIWRILISTFTFIQSPYCLHGFSSEALPTLSLQLRDCARFHFGFTVPYHIHSSLEEVIATVSTAPHDLGMIPLPVPFNAKGLQQDLLSQAWWVALTVPTAPKIIARLPFIERADHPLQLPVFIVSRPLAEASSKDILLFSLEIRIDSPDFLENNFAPALLNVGGEILASSLQEDFYVLLISLPGSLSEILLTECLPSFQSLILSQTWIGSHAKPLLLTSPPP